MIHLNPRSDLSDYSQGSSRAGRTGLPNKAYIFTTSNYQPTDPDLREFINTGRCRRTILDSVIDGPTDRTEYRENEAKCDICGPELENLSKSGISDTGLGLVKPE